MGLPEHAKEFAQNNIFGIDFDNRSVKIAKAINLIAGDGKSNVYKLNTLDSSHHGMTRANQPFGLC